MTMTNTQTPSVECPARIRIGTRGSALALRQAEEVKHRLLSTFPEQLTPEQIHIVPIMTTGDRIQDRSLLEIGGKGLFTKEIEDALFSHEIDLAVHSMKDMTDTLPEGLAIDCILEREDPRDAFLSSKAATLMDLPEGAVVGTSSIRRQTQALALRPDLKVVPFRGNINTRLKKLETGEVDATFLAVAGLTRLGLEEKITAIVDTRTILPAVAQGAIGIEYLEENHHIHPILQIINHHPSCQRVRAERAFLKTLGGSCATPIAGLAEFTVSGKLHFRGLVANPDAPQEIHRVEAEDTPENAEILGRTAGEALLQKAGHLLDITN